MSQLVCPETENPAETDQLQLESKTDPEETPLETVKDLDKMEKSDQEAVVEQLNFDAINAKNRRFFADLEQDHIKFENFIEQMKRKSNEKEKEAEAATEKKQEWERKASEAEKGKSEAEKKVVEKEQQIKTLEKDLNETRQKLDQKELQRQADIQKMKDQFDLEKKQIEQKLKAEENKRRSIEKEKDALHQELQWYTIMSQSISERCLSSQQLLQKTKGPREASEGKELETQDQEVSKSPPTKRFKRNIVKLTEQTTSDQIDYGSFGLLSQTLYFLNNFETNAGDAAGMIGNNSKFEDSASSLPTSQLTESSSPAHSSPSSIHQQKVNAFPQLAFNEPIWNLLNLFNAPPDGSDDGEHQKQKDHAMDTQTGDNEDDEKQKKTDVNGEDSGEPKNNDKEEDGDRKDDDEGDDEEEGHVVREEQPENEEDEFAAKVRIMKTRIANDPTVRSMYTEPRNWGVLSCLWNENKGQKSPQNVTKVPQEHILFRSWNKANGSLQEWNDCVKNDPIWREKVALLKAEQEEQKNLGIIVVAPPKNRRQ